MVRITKWKDSQDQKLVPEGENALDKQSFTSRQGVQHLMDAVSDGMEQGNRSHTRGNRESPPQRCYSRFLVITDENAREK